MFNFYAKKSRWLRSVPLAIVLSLAGTIWSYAQTTYYSKAAATDFNATASWGTNTDGTGAAPASVSTADNFVVQNGSLMTLTGSGAVRSLVINAGRLTVAGNTLLVEVPTLFNSSLLVNNGGTLRVTGGTVTINGRFEVGPTGGTGRFEQSGGSINVDGNAAGVTANSVASANPIVRFYSSNLDLTGGTLTIVDPHAATLGVAFDYNSGSAYNSPFGGHTVRFGNGVSTDAGGDATNGFRTSTWTGTSRFLFGNLTVDMATGTNRFVTHAWSHGINGNLTVTSGEFRTSATNTDVSGNIVNNGTLTTLGPLRFQNFLSGTASPVTTAQSVSGTGVFRNSATLITANFTSLLVNNNSSTGVTFSNANSVLSGANTGTVSGTLTFTSGIINPGANVFILGTSATSGGTLAFTSGGFAAGSTFRRWLTTSSLTTILSSTTPVFPFIAGTATDRHVFLARTTAFTAGGWIQASHTNGNGLTAAAFADGAYNVAFRTNASWTFTSGGGINVGASTLSAGFRGDGALVLIAAPGTAPRLTQAAAALGTHVAGAGTTSSPIANRSGLSLANLTSATHYIGVASADLPIYSVANGAWNTGATWNTGTPPTSTDQVLVSAGTTVTVNAAAAEAGLATILGTVNVTNNTLTVSGTAAANGLTIGAGGTLNVSAGTVEVGLSGNVTNNRTLTVATGGTLDVSSTGTVNVFGNLNFAANSFYNQSGGNINVDGNAGGNAANSVGNGTPIVHLLTNRVSGVTGGTLTIVDPHANTTANLAFSFNMAAGFNCAFGLGHTLRLGNGVSTDAGGNATNQFRIDHWFGSSRIILGNLTISAGSGTNRQVSHSFTSLTVGGDLTIDAGSEFVSIGSRFGGNVTNNGTLTNTGEFGLCTSLLSNFGAAATPNTQAIGGSGVYRNLSVSPTANANALRIGNSSVGGVTFNIPFTQIGTFFAGQGRINTTATNVLTHIKTVVGTSIGTTADFPNQAAYVTGPMRVQYNAAFGNAGVNFPVGTTEPSWLALFNFTNTGVITIEVQKNGSIAAPSTTDASLTGLVPGHEWKTTIVSGGANLTSFMFQPWSSAISIGNVIAGYTTAAGNFYLFGTGSNVTLAGAPLFNFMPQNNPVSLAAEFPERLAIGTTGPLNILSVTMAQSTVPAVLPAATRSSTNNNLARLIVAASGSIGSIALTDVTFTYTGTAPAADISAVTLWTGSFTAPVTQIGTSVVSGGTISFTGLNGGLGQNIISGVNYLWLRFDVTAGAALGNTVDVTLGSGDMTGWIVSGTTAPSGVPSAVQSATGDVTIDYCLPSYSTGCSGGDDGISNVTLVGNTVNINQNSGCPLTPFYTRYTSPIADLQQGSGYTVNVTMGADANQFARVWIDFDNNGVLDASESFVSGNAGANGTASIAITVPPGAVLGNTRMRVRGGDDSAPTGAQACGASGSAWGEGEDYTVEIISPTPQSITSVTATQQTGGIGISTTNNNLLRAEVNTSGSLGTQTLTQARFTYTGTAAADIAASGVTLWTGTISAPTTQVGSAVSLSGGLANFTGLSVVLVPGTNYLWLRVNSSASAVIGNIVDASIASGDFTIVASGGATPAGTMPVALVDPSGNRFIDYCAAGTTSGGGTDAVTNVALNGFSINLSNASGLAATPFYTFYNAVNKPDLLRGATYNVNVTMGSDGSQYSAVWLDFDNDGALETSEYFSTGTSAGGNGTAVISVAVPSGAFLGDIRMRVRGGSDNAYTSALACGILGNPNNFGEAEDYIVTIIPPPNCSTLLPLAANTTQASVTDACSGASVTFSLVNPMPVGSGFTYQLRRNGTNFGSAVSDLPIVSSLTASGNYDIQVLCNGTPALTATAVAITVYNPTMVSTTPGNRCGPGAVNLVGTGSAGTTIRWYTGLTGGTSVNEGLTPNTYNVTGLLAPSTTTFYAEANNVLASVNGGATSPSIGAFGGTVANAMIFNVLSRVTIVSAQLYPTAAGAAVFELRNSANVLLATANYNFTAGEANSTTSAIGTPVTVPLGFNVDAGTGYTIRQTSGPGCLRNSSGASAFYGVNNSGLVFTGNGFGDNNYWYQLYNLSIQGVCSSTPRLAAVATVTAPPAISFNTSSIDICDGQSVTASVSSTAVPAYTYTWSGGPFAPVGAGSSKTLTPTATTTYTVTANNGTCNNVNSVTINVRPTPTNPVASQVPVGGLCAGNTKTLNSTSSTTGSVVLFSENFNGGSLSSLGWSLNSTGTPTAPGNYWALQSTAFTYSTQITNFSFTTPASPFVVANSDLWGSGTSGTTSLVSPSFSTLGRSSGTISFSHVMRAFGSDEGRVDYSTDGGITWSPTGFAITATTPAQTWTASSIQTTTESVALPAGALNQANVRIRFHYTYSFDYYWMIDNLVISANDFVSYRWSSTNPFAGIPVGAQSYSPANTSVVVTPTEGGVMPYTVEAINSSGCTAILNGTTSFNVSKIELAVSITGPQRVGTTLALSSTVTGNFGIPTYQWRKIAGVGSGPTILNTNSGYTYPIAVENNSGTYQLTVSDGNGCSASASAEAIVYEALVWNGSVSNDWNTAANWTPNLIPKSPLGCSTDPLLIDNVIITNSGTPPVYPGSGVFVNNFGVETGQINISSVIRVCGSLSGGSGSVGMVGGPGTIELTGTGTSFVGGNLELDRITLNKTGAGSVTVQGTLTVKDLMTVTSATGGITVSSSGNVVLPSNATNTGKIGPIPAGTPIAVVPPGRFTLQRFTDVSAGTGRWIFMGSPMKNKLFTDWSDDFRVTGFVPGIGAQGGSILPTTNPERVNIFSYNEPVHNQYIDEVRRYGWSFPGAAESITPGKGYRVFVPNTGYSGRFDNEGEIYSGSINFNLTRNEFANCAVNATTTQACDELDRGWNLLANPYPCPVDWDAAGWTKPGSMNNAFYLWHSNSGQYRVYLGTSANGYSAGVNLGSKPLSGNADANIIPSSQSFFVKVISGSTATLIATEAVKSTTLNGQFSRSAVANELLKVRMSTPVVPNVIYESAIGLHDNATEGYDHNLDVDYLSGSNYDFRFVNGEGHELLLNSISVPEESKTIPMVMNYYGINGNFTLDFSNINGFEGLGVYLKDNFTGTLTDVKANPVYTYQVIANDGSANANRFEVVINPEAVTSTGKMVRGTYFNIYPNPVSGNNFVKLSFAGLRGENGRVEVLDMVGRVVFEQPVAIEEKKMNERSFDLELPAGVYTVKVKSGGKTLTEKLVIR